MEDFGTNKEWDAQVKDGVENPTKVPYTRIDITQHPETGTGIQKSTTGGKPGSASMMAMLEKHYVRTKTHYDEPEFDAYARDVRDIGNKLRQVWEAAVEDILLEGIVSRGKFKVQTMQLKGLLAFLAKDIAAINAGMEANDFYVHSTGEGWERQLPQLSTIRRRMDEFITWSKDYKQRREAARKGQGGARSVARPSSRAGLRTWQRVAWAVVSEAG